MVPNWVIAFVISGGASWWLYSQMLHRNGNQRDTLIATAIIWLIGFLVLFFIFSKVGI